MKILIGHNHYQTHGGEDAVVASEAALLRDNGENVVLYERNNKELDGLDPLKKAVHLTRLGHSTEVYRQLRELLRRERPHVAHFHNIFYMMTPAVYGACRDEGVPVVQSLHNFRLMCVNGLFFRDGHVCEDCVARGRWEGIRHRCLRSSALMSGAVSNAVASHWRKGTWLKTVTRYIVASEFARGKYVAAGIPSEKIFTKPNFLYPDPGVRRKTADYFLYVGRLSHEKGVEVLLEAWRSLPDVKLKILGSGPLEQKLKAFANDHKMAQVEFVGFADQSRYDAHMRGARAIVIPSVCYENFPRILAEAFAYGVPVVASRLGSLAELVEEGKTGVLIEAGNASELSRAVRWYCDNPMEVERMGHYARQTFEQKYSARVNYERLMQIYQKTIGSSKEQAR
jgi:glycosyltransferase involved in cell wall biosynthesis